MRINSLKLRNIRSYVDETIQFPTGNTLLSGDIGSGKSTILMALDFALFGLRRGELNGSDLLRHGQQEGWVELDVMINDVPVKIRRTLKRASAVAQETCTLIRNNYREQLTPIEAKARILEMLGYPQDMVKKNRPIFRYTVYTPQEEMKAILQDGEGRLEILRKIFSIDAYGTIRTNARVFVAELRAMKRELEAAASQLDRNKEEIEECRRSQERCESDIDRCQTQLLTLVERHETKRAEFEALKLRLQEARQLHLKATRAESDVQSLQRSQQQLDLELSNIDTKIQFNANLVFEPAEGSPDELQAALVMLQKDRDGMIRNIASVDNHIEKLSQIAAKGTCSFCGQGVADPASFAGQIEENKRRRQEIMEGIRQADARQEELRQKKTALERFLTLKRTVDDLRSWKQDKQAEYTRVSGSLRDVEALLLEMRTQLGVYESVEKESTAVEQELQEVQRERVEGERALARAEQQYDDTRRRIVMLQQEIARQEASRRKAQRIAGMVAWFDRFTELMEIIERHVLLTVQKEFNEFFQYWCSLLIGDALAVRIDDQFSPIIEQNGYETSFANLSGGEKTAVSLGYRLALNRVINRMIDAIRTKDLLILDEPTDGFSTDQLDRVRDVINALGLQQVILVSHEPKIDTYVENVIKVYKEDHMSRVATT